MQALSQVINLDNGDIITLSTDPLTEGGYMSIQIQRGNISMIAPVSMFKWNELLQKGADVAQTARIA